jgi:hypothetical protein
VTLSPRLRKIVLITHLLTSVGWIGAVGAFLALAVVGLTSPDTALERGSYLAMGVTGWYVITPLALATLVIGTLQALGTPWGLVRHYWVLAKLAITVVAVAVLLVKLGTISKLAEVAAHSPVSAPELLADRLELVVHSGGGLLVLIIPVVLSVYKPRGRTPFDRIARDAAAKPLP